MGPTLKNSFHFDLMDDISSAFIKLQEIFKTIYDLYISAKIKIIKF
jgi:hypothetical protein